MVSPRSGCSERSDFSVILLALLTLNKSCKCLSGYLAIELGNVCSFQHGNREPNCGKFDTPGQICSFGVPITWNILYNWSISLSPANKGFRNICEA